MELGPNGHIKLLGNLLKLTYVLNYGIAFGIQFGFKYSKLLITWVRIITTLGIAFHTIKTLKTRSVSSMWLWGWVLVLGGAIGNSIDSTFYGVYLNNAPDVAPMQWFHGQVIDMIHIDLCSMILPSWIPFLGGMEVYCFPIFNVADAALCIGLLLIVWCIHKVTAQNVDRLP